VVDVILLRISVPFSSVRLHQRGSSHRRDDDADQSFVLVFDIAAFPQDLAWSLAKVIRGTDGTLVPPSAFAHTDCNRYPPMNTSDPQNLVVAVLILIALVAVAWILMRQRQSRHLQGRFDPEYSRVLAEHRDRAKAEAELRARERRVEKLHLVPLTPGDAERFDQQWTVVQTQFVDDPSKAAIQADQLVRDLMVKRGYPVADFERRAADISVDHPRLVENYRAAQAIATLNNRGEASTEQLRKALVYYRDLFDQLLEVRGSNLPPKPNQHAQVRP
jgi:hypothetical protein